jgi:hypothetical protein
LQLVHQRDAWHLPSAQSLPVLQNAVLLTGTAVFVVVSQMRPEGTATVV